MKHTSLFSLFGQYAPHSIFLSVLTGLGAGFAYSLVIPLILLVYTPDPLNLETASSGQAVIWDIEIAHIKMATTFILLCLCVLTMRTCSQVIFMRVSLNIAKKLRTDIYHRILNAPIASIEAFGSTRLIAMFSTDIGNISMGARTLPDLMINSVTLSGALAFLFFLNIDVFWFVIVSVVIGTITYQLPAHIGNIFLRKSRNEIDLLYMNINGLIYGAKELKLDWKKRSDFLHNDLLACEDNVIRADRKAKTILIAATNYGELISFFVIGCVAFIFVNYSAITTTELISITMILLYIASPIGTIMNAFPQLAIAKISLKKINESLQLLPEEDEGNALHIPSWDTIHFKNVCFQYKPSGLNSSDNDKKFIVGPLNFSIKKGEVTFIVGGNGSGKSTIGKLLTLHYQAKAGEIYFGEERIDHQNLGAARQNISAIYSDYHLFNRLLGETKTELCEIESLIHKLGLSEKVRLSENRFSTLSLSDGQRKRLALLVSCLDNKQLYLFDEWAADQDPVFKSHFYHSILPLLKKDNKAIVVISHDDRYFNFADLLIEMEDGQIIRKSRPKQTEGFVAEFSERANAS
ncbi:cyclic peptide export ABC transporter [Vibrio vulnificus]|uniref:cyclic peptide export ABC transporter n=1 Tax=Vibrio vulnificus TaxID=672 RepID=UPI0010299049|nr:cyclic peptide export ABC transporter [Vibrio vulnificus]RZP95571.1 cyclic peptide export ABC transporter [Vibrio vulnificus]